MLEIADKGFDELSSQIDQYIEEFKQRSSKGDFDIEINSLTLEEYVINWAESTNFQIVENEHKPDFSDLVNELNDLGLKNISELIKIIPSNYPDITKKYGYSTTILGLLRDWMIIYDYKKYHEEVSFNWLGIDSESHQIIESYLNEEQMKEFYEMYKDHYFIEDEYIE